MVEIRGMVPGLPTPFTEDDEIDEPALRAIIDYFLNAGVHGFFPLGTVGQGPQMTLDERMRAAEIIMDQVAGRVPVVMQIGTADTRSSITLAKHAQSLGVAAIGLLPLYYGRASEDAVLDHFKRVSDAVPLPIFMYDNTGTTQFKNSPKFIERLLREVPMVKGCKMSSYDMQDRFAWLRQVPPDFCYLEGYTEFLSVVVPLGAKGCMSPRTVVAPEMMVDVWNTIMKGDWNVSIPKLVNLWDTFKGVDDIAGREQNREILRMRGIPIQRMPRSSPTKGASPEVVQKLAKFLAEKGVPVKEPAAVA